MNFILENVSKIGITILVAICVQVLGVALTCLLARSISKANYEEIRWGCRGQDTQKPFSTKRRNSSKGQLGSGDLFEEQKQPLTSKSCNGGLNVTSPVPAQLHSSVQQDQVLPPVAPQASQSTAQWVPQQISSNPCPVAQNSVVASCAGCAQYSQQCQQQQQEAMEMTAILHSQPQALQLVSCHGPIMHPSTPSNQR